MIDWERVLYLTLVSRFLDDTEEQRLVPEKKVLYQFSARGHDVAQLILGQHLTHFLRVVGARGQEGGKTLPIRDRFGELVAAVARVERRGCFRGTDGQVGRLQRRAGHRGGMQSAQRPGAGRAAHVGGRGVAVHPLGRLGSGHRRGATRA